MRLRHIEVFNAVIIAQAVALREADIGIVYGRLSHPAVQDEPVATGRLHVRTLLPEVPVEVRALQPMGLRSPQPVLDFRRGVPGRA